MAGFGDPHMDTVDAAGLKLGIVGARDLRAIDAGLTTYSTPLTTSGDISITNLKTIDSADIRTTNGSLTISRALISDNLGKADLATGIAGLGIASTSNLGGALLYTSSDPKKDAGMAISQTVGSDSASRFAA